MSKDRVALNIANNIVRIENQIALLKNKRLILKKQFVDMFKSVRIDSMKPSLHSSLIRFFDFHREESFTIKKVIEGFSEYNSATIRSTISRLSRAGFLEQVGRGQYRFNKKNTALTRLE